jgi:hypothetical protein
MKQTIKILLADGSPSGVKIAEIGNWTGIVTACSRSQLASLEPRPEVRRTGIYILAGEDPENPTQEVVYIGESENVLPRLAEHTRDEDKEFWIRTLVVTQVD